MSAQPKITEAQKAHFEILRRRYLQAIEKERASQYADPQKVLEGEESFEQKLPLSEVLNLRRAGFRFDD